MSPASVVGVVLAVLGLTACRDLPRTNAPDAGRDAVSQTGSDVRPEVLPRDAAPAPDAPAPPADMLETPVDAPVEVDSTPAAALWDEATWDLSLWGP